MSPRTPSAAWNRTYVTIDRDERFEASSRTNRTMCGRGIDTLTPSHRERLTSLDRELVALRVPSGWAVLFNIFVEFADDEVISPQDVECYLSDDILSMESMHFSDGHWRTDPDGWVIDLGWRDPGDPGGQYVLRVARGSWESGTAVFRHRSCARVRAAIDVAMLGILAGRDMAGLAKAFDRMER